jgi:hypothetical protein
LRRGLLRKQAHQPQGLHVGGQGETPARQAPAAFVKLQRADARMVEMAQGQGGNAAGQGFLGQNPALPGPGFRVLGHQAPVGQHQQTPGKPKLRVQVNQHRT